MTRMRRICADFFLILERDTSTSLSNRVAKARSRKVLFWEWYSLCLCNFVSRLLSEAEVSRSKKQLSFIKINLRKSALSASSAFPNTFKTTPNRGFGLCSVFFFCFEYQGVRVQLVSTFIVLDWKVDEGLECVPIIYTPKVGFCTVGRGEFMDNYGFLGFVFAGGGMWGSEWFLLWNRFGCSFADCGFIWLKISKMWFLPKMCQIKTSFRVVLLRKKM